MKAYPSFSLENRQIVVTGASRGIGRELALGFAAAGADIVLLGRDKTALDEVVQQIQNDYCRSATCYVCDLTDTRAIRETVAAIGAKRPIDVLINNAGLNIRTPALEVSDEEWKTIIDTDLRGAFFMAQQVGQQMVERSSGSIINISSVGGHVALRTGVVYAAAKAGVIQMTKVLALEWGGQGVRVNCIAPWYFRTPLTENLLNDGQYHAEIVQRTPLRRVGNIEELVGPAVFLASDASSYVTGHTLFVDGGMAIYGF